MAEGTDRVEDEDEGTQTARLWISATWIDFPAVVIWVGANMIRRQEAQIMES